VGYLYYKLCQIGNDARVKKTRELGLIVHEPHFLLQVADLPSPFPFMELNKTMITRREFVRNVATSFVALQCAGQLGIASPKSPPFRISLAEWSLHHTLFAGKLDNLDFAKTSKQEFGIDAIEYVNQFFKDKAQDKKYLAELKARSEDLGVKTLLIMIDNEGKLGDPDAKKQKQAVENHFKWIEAAKFLDCHSIRVNAASDGSYDEQVSRAANGLRILSEFAKDFGLNVIVENHGGLSSNGKWLAQVIRKVALNNCGTLPDFGNFDLGDGKTYDRYQGVKELMPFAKAVSAKSNEFDDQGQETETDFLRMMKIVRAAGYSGYVGIEYAGKQLAEPAGILATKKLLEKVRDQLA
jgi:sugar phosphate isomerase/epimerase